VQRFAAIQSPIRVGATRQLFHGFMKQVIRAGSFIWRALVRRKYFTRRSNTPTQRTT
jgi:hypothetical protein